MTLYLIIVPFGHGQYPADVVAAYELNGNANDLTGNGSNGMIIGGASFECGPEGSAISLDGNDDIVSFTGLVGDNFGPNDLTFAFYFKPGTSLGREEIFSKAETCDNFSRFGVSYIPSSRTLEVAITENDLKNNNVSAQLPTFRCWYHVAIVKKSTQGFLYIDGVLVDEAQSPTLVDLTNNADLLIAEGPCIGGGASRFSGLIDQVLVVRRALVEQEILGLLQHPDRIINRDTVIFEGADFQLNTTSTCATGFNWKPPFDISDPSISNPRYTGNNLGVYEIVLEFNYDDCRATDTLQVQVIDPANADCTQLFLPNAFTPNADNRNDTYGIDNPFIIQNLEYFEIFDRLGNRVFYTTNAFDRWDGKFQDKDLTPGVYLYRILFQCMSEELSKTGTFSIVK